VAIPLPVSLKKTFAPMSVSPVLASVTIPLNREVFGGSECQEREKKE